MVENKLNQRKMKENKVDVRPGKKMWEKYIKKKSVNKGR